MLVDRQSWWYTAAPGSLAPGVAYPTTEWLLGRLRYAWRMTPRPMTSYVNKERRKQKHDSDAYHRSVVLHCPVTLHLPFRGEAQHERSLISEKNYSVTYTKSTTIATWAEVRSGATDWNNTRSHRRVDERHRRKEHNKENVHDLHLFIPSFKDGNKTATRKAQEIGDMQRGILM